MAMAQVEICACGHPLSRHELVGTEYVRCQKHPWRCYCTGESRVVLLVNETLERPSGSQTNGKYFRRAVGEKKHPLNSGLSRIQDIGIRYEWVVEECEKCGLPREEWEDVTAIQVDGLVSGKNQVVCGICIFEIEEAERRRNG